MQFDPEKITFFAQTDARGQAVPFGIKAKDRQRHMYVVGKTGMGKSTLLENMAVQDIQNGEGMAFIDPHGSAAETLLDYVPPDRVDDVIYFAPFDLNNPISFNVMEDVGADKRHLVVSGLMSTFKKIWVDAWSARMEYILTNALLVLIEYPDTTLLSVNRLFSDKAYRKKVVEACTDPAVKSFWVDEFANYTDRFAAEALPAIQNKIGQFTGNPLIRNVIGQPKSSFDIREIMDNRKILIMNLSKGLIGETNANLLGSMLTTRIYLAAMSRADLPVEKMRKMPNFYFYVDEFQSFANATFANILSEARKYHLNLIIAHQYIEQMEEEVRDAVFGNVGTTVSFRVGPFDAETLETVFTPQFLAADLVNLGFAQIYLTLMIDGIGSQPFSAVTLPPIAAPSVSCKQMVISASRKNYTKPRADVEQLVNDLHTPDTPAAAKANNNNNNKPQGKPPARPTNNGANNNNQHSNNRPSAGNNSASSNGTHNRPALSASAPAAKPQQSFSRPAPDNKSPRKEDTTNQNTTANKSSDRSSTERPARPAPKPAAPSKSSADLKAILAKIAEESGQPKNSPKKGADPASKKPASTTKPNDSLKSALAGLVNSTSEKKSDISSTNSSRSTPPKQSSAPAAKSAPSRAAQSTAPPRAEQKASPEPDTAKLAAELAAAEAVLDGASASELDPKKVQHILKAPTHERSPFS